MTEESFEKYTNKLLSLKLYHTKNKHLELKEKEKIIKRLLHDVIDNIFYTIIKLEDIKVILAQKSKIYDDMQKEIEIIKMSIKYENDLKKEIENIYNVYITDKLEKEKEIKENNEKVKQLSDKNDSIVDEIKSLLNIKVKTEEEKLKEYKIKELKNKSKYLEKEISQIKAEIDNKIKKKEELNIKINETKKNLDVKEEIIKYKNEKVTKALEEIFKKEQEKEKLEVEKKRLEKKLKEYKDNAIRKIENL